MASEIQYAHDSSMTGWEAHTALKEYANDTENTQMSKTLSIKKAAGSGDTSTTTALTAIAYVAPSSRGRNDIETSAESVKTDHSKHYGKPMLVIVPDTTDASDGAGSGPPKPSSYKAAGYEVFTDSTKTSQQKKFAKNVGHQK
eukprot:scpid78338/ scgid30856/ 